MREGAVTGSLTRRVISVVLAITGAATLFVGGITLYAREQIFDADQFAQNASDLLGDERADEAIANPIVDQVIANGPDELINARPLLSSAAQGVLDSRPFRDAFRKALIRVHRQLFSRDRDELILNIADATGFVVDAVRAISPETARQIPDNLEAGLIELTDSDFAIGAVRTGESIRFLGLFLPFLGLAMLAGSVAVAPDRRRGLVTASAAVAIASAIGVIALVVGRAVDLGQFDDDVTRDAVDAAWGVFLDGLSAWFFASGVVSIVFAAAASTVGEVDVTAPARRIWRFAIHTPQRTAWRAARAIGLLAVSVWVVLQPDLALNVAAVLVGAYGLFFAVSELLVLIAPPPPEGVERVRLRTRIRPRPAVLTAAVVAAAVAIGVAELTEEDVAHRPSGPVQACNGYPELCDRHLSEVAFPGAHNAMSAANADFITPNHRKKISQQLDDGVRVLLIDAYYGIERSSGPVLTDLERERDRTKVNETIRDTFGGAALKRVQSLQRRVADSGEKGKRSTYLCHIVCELGAIDLTDTLTEVREFLDTHPDEFLIIVIEDYIDPEDVEAAFEDSGLVRYAYTHARDTPLPTLRELIEADQRVLVMAENQDGGTAVPWYHDGFELMQETPYEFKAPGELEDYGYSCKPNRGTDGPVLQFNHWVEKLPRSPKTGAQVNAYDLMLERAKRCKRRRALLPNLVAVDFYDEGDLFEVTRRLNGLSRRAEPEVRETG